MSKPGFGAEGGKRKTLWGQGGVERNGCCRKAVNESSETRAVSL